MPLLMVYYHLPFVRDLFENRTLTLEEAYTQARALDLAQKHSESYSSNQFSNAIPVTHQKPNKDDTEDTNVIGESAATVNKKCYFCGNKFHPRSQCPAKSVECHSCGKRGHFSKVCGKRDKASSASASMFKPVLSTVCSRIPKDGLSTATQDILVNGKPVPALFDTGSTENFVDEKFVRQLSLTVYPASGTVSMATSALSSEVLGYCIVDITLNDAEYKDTKLTIMRELCKPIIMGLSFMKMHNSFTILFGGSKSDITVCGLASANIDPPALFTNLTSQGWSK